jgi:hypothetical protein
MKYEKYIREQNLVYCRVMYRIGGGFTPVFEYH